METSEAAPDVRGFTAVTEDGLARLAPGCFVLVRTETAVRWIEIGEFEGELLSGIVHAELGDAPDPARHGDRGARIRFRREQILALGCDRFCWC
jgi:hypothetical protein